MAVDKSFVVKNGLEVNSDLIVADANSKKVGIASTSPRSTLDVRGGIAATDGNFTGILTAASVDIADFGVVNGSGANITGFSTLGGLSVDQLTVTGVATFADLSYDEITGRNLNLTGIATVPVVVGLTSFTDGVEVTGISTYAEIDTTNLNISGVGTVATANITTLSNYPNFTGGATVVGTVTAAHFSGGGLGVGIKTSGSVIGYGFTMLNFVGSGNTFAVNGKTVDISIAGGGGGGGSASIGVGSTPGDAFTGIITAGNLWYNTGLGRLFIYYQDDNSAQWVDAAPFNVGIITTLSNVAFSTGTASSPAISFGNDSNTGFYLPVNEHPAVTSNGSEVARFNPSGVNVSGITTATGFKVGTAISISDGAVSATRFHGDGSNLTGIDATSLKDSGGNVKAQANPGGVVITGVATATTFVGNLTGDVIGDVTGDVTGNTSGTAGGLTGTPNITVGSVAADSLVVSGVSTLGEVKGISGVSTTFVSAIGIQSGGNTIGTGITQLNFVGSGNTFKVTGTTVDISIEGGGGGGGLSTTGVSTGYILSNPSTLTISADLTQPGYNYGLFGPITIGSGVTITVGAGNSFTIV